MAGRGPPGRLADHDEQPQLSIDCVEGAHTFFTLRAGKRSAFCSRRKAAYIFSTSATEVVVIAVAIILAIAAMTSRCSSRRGKLGAPVSSATPDHPGNAAATKTPTECFATTSPKASASPTTHRLTCWLLNTNSTADPARSSKTVAAELFTAPQTNP